MLVVKYKFLKQRHQEYNPFNRLNRLYCLYRAGYDITNSADLFLYKLNVESDTGFSDRLKFGACTPVMSSKIGFLVGILHSQAMNVRLAADKNDPTTYGTNMDEPDVYKQFLRNADGHNNSLDFCLAECQKKALLYTKMWWGIDFKQAPDVLDENGNPLKDEQGNIQKVEINNLYQEEMYGTGNPYIYEIDPLCVVDWKFRNENYDLEWIKLCEDVELAATPLEEKMHQIVYTTWEYNNGTPVKKVYKSPKLKPNMKEPANDSDFSEQTFINHTFKDIPILVNCIPADLAIGEKIGPLCEDIFQRESFVKVAQCKAAGAMIFLQMSGGDNVLGGSPFRFNNVINEWEQRGFGVIDREDLVTKVEIEGGVFEILNTMIKSDIDEIDKVLNQIAMSSGRNQNKLTQSADSKVEDRYAMNIMLTQFGEGEKNFIKKVLNIIAGARNEELAWEITGRDDYRVVDRGMLLTEAQMFPNILEQLTKISPTAGKIYAKEFTNAIIGGNLSSQDAMDINDEIDNKDLAGLSLDGYGQTPQAQAASQRPQPAVKGKTAPTDDKNIDPNTGHEQLDDDAHVNDGRYIDPQIVYDQLSEDYKPSAIEWVLDHSWTGPQVVPLSSINFSNQSSWSAAKPARAKQIEDFKQQITDEGKTKPIILANETNNNEQMHVLDGHGRSTAYKQAGKDPVAYVVHTGRLTQEMKLMHSQQTGNSKQKNKTLVSNQKTKKPTQRTK